MSTVPTDYILTYFCCFLEVLFFFPLLQIFACSWRPITARSPDTLVDAKEEGFMQISHLGAIAVGTTFCNHLFLISSYFPVPSR